MNLTKRLILGATVLVAASLSGSSAFAQTPTPVEDPGFSIANPNARTEYWPGDELTFAVAAPKPGAIYVWVWGDGTPSSTGPRVKHRFPRVGDFDVKLQTQERLGAPATMIGHKKLELAPAMLGVFASDIDGQFTPADQFQLAVTMRAPGVDVVDIRTSGTLLGARTAQFKPTGNDDFFIFDNMSIANETDPIIREELLRKPGNKIAMANDVFTMAIDYKVPGTNEVRTRRYSPAVKDFFEPAKTVEIIYPDFKLYGGVPEDPLETGNYYTKGNEDFNAQNDFYVRAMALRWARRGGAWPDEPGAAAMNIFTTIDALFDDGEPGDFNNVYNIARLVDEGRFSETSKNTKYICIAQAYMFTGLARTLGLPAREFNNAIGEASWQGNDGVWRVKWWQEAGLELWYHGEWHYFDTWWGATHRSQYLTKNLIYQSWAAYSPQTTPFATVDGRATGLRGHSFDSFPGNPPQWTYIEEGIRPGIVVEGSVGQPVAASITGIPALQDFARPAAAGILALPMLAKLDNDRYLAGPSGD